MKHTLRKLFDFFSSYGFAIVLLFFLLMLTFLGTVEQVNSGLYEVQKKYFESAFVVHWLMDTVPIPLPGVYLLMCLFFVNMVLGAIFRAPKSWKRPGLLIAHGGILLLVLFGFVTYHFSNNGHMRLYEGESSNEFESYYDWEVTITETPSLSDGDTVRQWIIPQAALAALSGEGWRTFTAPDLPFALELHGFMKNAAPRPAPPGDASSVDGVFLEALAGEKDAERNIAGVKAVVVAGEKRTKGLLWGMALAPWQVEAGDRVYAIALRHTRWEIPFTITLDKFTRDLHPGTSMASNFMSEVTKAEDGAAIGVIIKMNEPLRSQGYTFFQASWGPQEAGPNTPLFSVFSVVKNPADQWPVYACYIITLGLLIHFTQALLRFLRREHRSRA